jgi:hypothetical protein
LTDLDRSEKGNDGPTSNSKVANVVIKLLRDLILKRDMLASMEEILEQEDPKSMGKSVTAHFDPVEDAHLSRKPISPNISA